MTAVRPLPFVTPRGNVAPFEGVYEPAEIQATAPRHGPPDECPRGASPDIGELTAGCLREAPPHVAHEAPLLRLVEAAIAEVFARYPEGVVSVDARRIMAVLEPALLRTVAAALVSAGALGVASAARRPLRSAPDLPLSDQPAPRDALLAPARAAHGSLEVPVAPVSPTPPRPFRAPPPPLLDAEPGGEIARRSRTAFLEFLDATAGTPAGIAPPGVPPTPVHTHGSTSTPPHPPH